MFPDSSLVFVADTQARFVPAKVNGAIQPGQSGHVWLLDDAGRPKFQLEIPGSLTTSLVRMDDESLRSIPDMVDFKVLTEAAVLHNLRLRFRADEIYTSIGDVLIAVNPFKMLPLYTPIVLDSYISSSAPSANPPHIFKVADTAFRRLVQFRRNQACLVTGESGSGKTETTKVFLQYLAEVSSAWSGTQGPIDSAGKNEQHHQGSGVLNATLSDKILKSNPLLESFGNASTRKNANSSRFGKLIEISIDTNTAEISGANTTIFLLEKSRLPGPAEGERNFHIFYQLCAGARVHPELREQYEVLDEDEYRYLQVDALSPTRSADILGWEDLVKSMSVLKISMEHRDEALRMVSGILHLGNLEFEADSNRSHSEASKVANPATLAVAERLLGLKDLEKALTSKIVSAGADTLFQHQNADKARKLRDALAIVLYSTLFNFMAARVNVTMTNDSQALNAVSASANARRTMGVLDIFGFEAFPGANNSFEQLCINYCNEKLQHQFNEYVFSKERMEYERECVVFSSNPSALLEKSQKGTMLVLELFEKPRVGLFHLMDEESAIPGGSDAGLLKKMIHEYPSWNSAFALAKKELLNLAFVVRHYAGPVIYKVAGLLEKNEEGSLSKDLHLLCSQSSLEIIRSAVGTNSVSGNSTGIKTHLGTQFAAQLDRLVKSLSEMEPHFVRCIKPNEDRKGGAFHAGMVLDQLRCAGILEVCKIRQLGFPIRKEFLEFKNRYAPLTKSSRRFISGPDLKLAVETMCGEFLSNQVFGDPANFACGKTKIFLKSFALIALEERLEKLRSQKVLIIQRRARGYLARKSMTAVRRVLREAIPRAIEASALADLRAALGNESLKRLLQGGKHITIVQQGWKKAMVLQEHAFGRNLITRAISLNDSRAIRSALTCTAKIVPQDDAILVKAQSVLKDLLEDDALVHELESQIAVVDIPDSSRTKFVEALEEIITRAEARIMRPSEVTTKAEPQNPRRLIIVLDQAKAKVARLTEETEHRKRLEAAIDSRSGEVVVETKAKLVAIGVSAEDALLRRASMFLREEIVSTTIVESKSEDTALLGLDLAIEARDPDAIAAALVPVIAQGLDGHPRARQAVQLEKSLRLAKENERALDTIASVLEIKTKSPGASGLNPEDLAIVSEVCEQVSESVAPATEQKLPDTEEDEEKAESDSSSEIKARADMLIATAQEIVEAQNALHAALAIGMSIEFSKLRATLERAYACGLTSGELVYRVQKMMRAKTRERRLAKKKVVFDISGKVPEKRKKTDVRPDIHSGAELLTMARAEGSRYILANYYQVRTPVEGDPPVIQHKQGRVLEQCLLEATPPILSSDGSNTAETISKLILGYTGERSASFPPTCAQSLLELGSGSSELGDELYVQICAHLTENTNIEAATRSWQLLCLMVAAFSPSLELLPFTVRFLLDRAEGRTDAAMSAERVASGTIRGPLPTTLDNYTLEQRYAWYALRRLLHELVNSSSPSAIPTTLPSMEEIQAFGERVPFVTNITYPDGSVLLSDALISPTMTVQDVTQLCLKAAQISQHELAPTFGIFVRPVDKAAMAALAAAAVMNTSNRGESSATLVRDGSSYMANGTNGDDDRNKNEGETLLEPQRRSSFKLRRATSKSRFRLSITAVFGFARGGATSGSWNPKSIANAANEAGESASATENGGDEPVALFGNATRSKAVGTTRPNGPGALNQQKKKSALVGVKRTEDELDWDVPLVPGDFIGDIVLRYLRAGRGAPRLVFKKRVFIPELETKCEDVRKKEVKMPEMASTQVAVRKIEVFQAVDDYSTGALPFDKEDDVAEVVAARVAIKFDNRLPATDPERLMSIAQIETFVPAPWRAKKSELNWARTVLEKQAKVNGKDTEVLNQRVLEKCKSRPLYGAQLFRVTKKGEPLESLLAVSKHGFTLLSAKDYRTLVEYSFTDLQEFRVGKGGTFWLQPLAADGQNTLPKATVLVTANAREIAAIAQEYERVFLGWDPKNGSAEACRRLLADRNAPSSLRLKVPVTSPNPAVESPRGEIGDLATSTPRGLAGPGRTLPAATIDEATGDGNDVPTESLRERMEKMGATPADIAEVLRV